MAKATPEVCSPESNLGRLASWAEDVKALLSRALPSIVSRTVTVDQLFDRLCDILWSSALESIGRRRPCATAPSHGGGTMSAIMRSCVGMAHGAITAGQGCPPTTPGSLSAALSSTAWSEEPDDGFGPIGRSRSRGCAVVILAFAPTRSEGVSGIQDTLVFHTNQWSGARTQLHQARRIITLILAPSGGDISQESLCVKAPISTRVSLQQSAISSVHVVLTSLHLTPHSLSLSL